MSTKPKLPSERIREIFKSILKIQNDDVGYDQILSKSIILYLDEIYKLNKGIKK